MTRGRWVRGLYYQCHHDSNCPNCGDRGTETAAAHRSLHSRGRPPCQPPAPLGCCRGDVMRLLVPLLGKHMGLHEEQIENVCSRALEFDISTWMRCHRHKDHTDPIPLVRLKQCTRSRPRFEDTCDTCSCTGFTYGGCKGTANNLESP